MLIKKSCNLLQSSSKFGQFGRIGRRKLSNPYSTLKLASKEINKRHAPFLGLSFSLATALILLFIQQYTTRMEAMGAIFAENRVSEDPYAESSLAGNLEPRRETKQKKSGYADDPEIIAAIQKCGIQSLNLESPHKYKIHIETSKKQIIIRLDAGDEIDRMIIVRDQPDRTIFNRDKVTHTSLTENDTRHTLLRLGLIQRLKSQDHSISTVKTFTDNNYPIFEADFTIPGEFLHVIGYRRRCQLYTLITMVPSIFDKKLYEKEKLQSENIFKRIDFQPGELLKEPVCFDILRGEKRYIEMAMMAELGNGIQRNFDMAIHYWEKVLEKKDLTTEQDVIDELFFGLKDRVDFFEFVKLRIQKLKELNDKINGEDDLLPPVAAQFLKNSQKKK